eukprot:gene221-1765_t
MIDCVCASGLLFFSKGNPEICGRAARNRNSTRTRLVFFDTPRNFYRGALIDTAPRFGSNNRKGGTPGVGQYELSKEMLSTSKKKKVAHIRNAPHNEVVVEGGTLLYRTHPDATQTPGVGEYEDKRPRSARSALFGTAKERKDAETPKGPGVGYYSPRFLQVGESAKGSVHNQTKISRISRRGVTLDGGKILYQTAGSDD